MNTKSKTNSNQREYILGNKKKSQVTYGFKGGKWNFRVGTFTLLTNVPGGKENADRIAELLRNSWLRHKSVDGTARSAINKIVNTGFTQLKDYVGPWDHNFSWKDRRSVTDTIVTPEVEITGVAPAVEAEPDAVAA